MIRNTASRSIQQARADRCSEVKLEMGCHKSFTAYGSSECDVKDVNKELAGPQQGNFSRMTWLLSVRKACKGGLVTVFSWGRSWGQRRRVDGRQRFVRH
jgi:hypothetical protein